MKTSFRAVIIGGTGSVGNAVVTALQAAPACREVVMIVRRPVEDREKVRGVVLDTAATDFETECAALARSVIAQGDRVSAVSCIGVGSGSRQWSEDELRKLEIGVVGAFARGCHVAGIRHFCLLTAGGSNPRSVVRYARVMGEKEGAINAIGFPRVAIFRPGLIAGNAHTPAWAALVGSVFPFSLGTVAQTDLARSFVREIALHGDESGEVVYGNKEMRAGAT